jgi:hypothetical protein
MVRVIVGFTFLLFSAEIFAQEENAFVYKNMLKATATLAPGYMFSQTQTNIYVHGHLEYFPEEKISLRGDVFWFVGAQQKPQLLSANNTLLFGGLYHMHKNRFDFFIGMQTGMGFTKPADTNYDIYNVNGSSYTLTQGTNSYTLKALPVLSPFTGITFYPGKYVNFFLEARYVSGRYFGYNGGLVLHMDEIRISAGLGFQIPFKKK